MFKTVGRVQLGGQIKMQYPAGEDWFMAAAPAIAFEPPIGSVSASGVWANSTRMLTVTTSGGDIESDKQVVMTVGSVRTPSDTHLASSVTVTTLSPAGLAID